jgi:uncharacterized protein
MIEVTITGAARQVLDEIRAESGDAPGLLFMIGGGCCDNTAPMLLRDFRVGATDVQLGEIAGVPVWCEREQAALVEGFRLEIGLSSGGGNSFSLEIPRGVRFVLRSS